MAAPNLCLVARLLKPFTSHTAEPFAGWEPSPSAAHDVPSACHDGPSAGRDPSPSVGHDVPSPSAGHDVLSAGCDPDVVREASHSAGHDAAYAAVSCDVLAFSEPECCDVSEHALVLKRLSLNQDVLMYVNMPL